MILSNIAILICEHFLCKGDVTPADNKSYCLQKSCLVNIKVEISDWKGSEKTQNQEQVNKIPINLSDKIIDRRRIEEKFDERIIVLLYRYEPSCTCHQTFHSFSNNGTIGIIIKIMVYHYTQEILFDFINLG